jgi:predicted GNAT superfamily acetyltransferase
VQKNAAFNISKLGVEVVAYYPDFYGSMNDSVNAGDASDRIMAKWNVSSEIPKAPHVFSDLPSNAISIPIPEDIVEMRAKSADEAKNERLRVRTQFLEAFKNEYKVIGFSKTSGYILSKEKQ